MFDSEESAAEFTIHLYSLDPSNPGQDSWKIKVLILKQNANCKF